MRCVALSQWTNLDLDEVRGFRLFATASTGVHRVAYLLEIGFLKYAVKQ